MAPSFGNRSIDDLLKPFSGKYFGQPLVAEGYHLVRAVEEDVPDKNLFRLRLSTAIGQNFCVTIYMHAGDESKPAQLSITGVYLSHIIALTDLASTSEKVSLLGIKLSHNPDRVYELICARTPKGELDFTGQVLETLEAYAQNKPKE